MKMNDYSKILKLIEGANKILVFSHTNADGDAAGAALGLSRALRAMGKGAFFIMEDDFPGYLSFLTKDLGGMPYIFKEAPFVPDLSIAVDISTDERLEGLKDIFYTGKHTVSIDHHPSENPIGEAYVVDETASAASLLIFELLEEGKIAIDRKTAECLYTGILTDTGSFRYSNTDKRTFEAVAKLYDFGIRSSEICSAIYENYPLAQLKLEDLAIDRARFYFNGAAALSWCEKKDLEKAGASQAMEESCMTRLRNIEGVELAAFVRERGEKLYKVSLRAKSYGNVNVIAKYFGGGGHEKAAGCTMKGDLEDIISKIAEAMTAELNILYARHNRRK